MPCSTNERVYFFFSHSFLVAVIFFFCLFLFYFLFFPFHLVIFSLVLSCLKLSQIVSSVFIGVWSPDTIQLASRREKRYGILFPSVIIIIKNAIFFFFPIRRAAGQESKEEEEEGARKDLKARVSSKGGAVLV